MIFSSFQFESVHGDVKLETLWFAQPGKAYEKKLYCTNLG